MEPLEQALAFDARDEPVEAARAYEEALAAGDADLDTHLNLAVLLFVCNDFGYLSHHHLSWEFVGYAETRMFEVLDAARRRWGRQSDVEFWERYFRFTLYGEALPNDLCLTLARQSASLEPYLFANAFIVEGHRIWPPEARTLLERVRSGSTARQRYVRSVLHPEQMLDAG